MKARLSAKRFHYSPINDSIVVVFSYARNAFSRVGVKIWNGIPATLIKSAKKIF